MMQVSNHVEHGCRGQGYAKIEAHLSYR
jgi:hypothetical protein